MKYGTAMFAFAIHAKGLTVLYCTSRTQLLQLVLLGHNGSR
jgi:hypothetical protein